MCYALSGIEWRWPTINWSYTLRAPFLHFALAFVVAWLLLRLILIILRYFSVTPTDELRTRPYLFWLSLSVAIVSHVLEDWYLGWF